MAAVTILLPDIVNSGVGTYASFTPVITNGVITSVNVVSSGVGFATDKSFLRRNCD